MKRRLSNPRFAAGVAAVLLLLHVAAVRAWLSPEGDGVRVAGSGMLPACAFRLGTGLPCPNCGMTRSVALAARGRIADAAAANPAGPAALGSLLLAIAALLARALLPGPDRGRRLGTAAAVSMAVTAVIWAGHWLHTVARL